MYANSSVGYDTTFELNEFQEPRIRSEAETLKDVLMFILFSKPGQYPSLPQIGLDIESYLYSFYDEIDEEDLKTKIIDQCSLLGAYFSNGMIGIKKLMYAGEPSLIIAVQCNETYPSSYKHDNINNVDQFMIGITYDQLHNMIYTQNTQKRGE